MVTIDPRTLDVFRAVAQTGSATRAAEQLNTTQPSVTRAIGAFEKACGFTLFERGRYGMTLTPKGAMLLHSVDRNYAGLRAIQRTISEIRDSLQGSLWAIAIPVVAEGALGSLIGAFMRDHPGVSINLKTGYPEEVVNKVALGEVDIGAIIGAPPVSSGLVALPIGRRHMTLTVAPHHRLANRQSVHIRELDGEAFVMIVRPHNIRLAIEAMIADCGVRPSRVHEATTQRSVAELGRHSDAVGFVDTEVVESLKPGSLVAVGLEPAYSWTINLIHRRVSGRSPVLTAFLAWLETRSGS